MRPSKRLAILAVLLGACTNGSSSARSPAALEVQGISVPDFGSWQANRPIEFAFSEPIDFASVSGRSIRIRTSADVPAAGTFEAKTSDADGDGLPEAIDERVVVFYPRCPRAADLSDAGLLPGVRYLVTLAGDDSGEDPGSLLRSVAGHTLARSVVRVFETIADPVRTLYDERPNAAPRPILRAPGASAGSGCYLELGQDPARRVHFEGVVDSGRLQGGFLAPLNLLGDPATRAAFVVVFDQQIRSTPENLARLSLEYNPVLALSGWIRLETGAELVSNCRPGEVAVRLVGLGAFPAGGFVRVRIDGGFEDVAGEAAAEPLEGFAIAGVATLAFTSLDPADAIADEIREEFDFGPESPLSFADPALPEDAGPAQWGDGELRANPELRLPPELQEFDWVVRRGETFVFDTAATSVSGGPDGSRTMTQETSGGFVRVRTLLVEEDARIRVVGPNPMVVHAADAVVIRGIIEASGRSAPELDPFEEEPGEGGSGGPAGGDGGSGTGGGQVRGGHGSGAFGSTDGGGAGESGLSSQGGLPSRGGGGAGGRFARDQGPLVAENGADGPDSGTGAESAPAPARGGVPGPGPFTDGDPANDFFGIEPVVDGAGVVVGKRRGELRRIHAGAGGGNGGDSIAADVFPPPAAPELVQEGGGGGGGGGAILIRARGRISFGSFGRIRANGGSGASRRGAFDVTGGACGGSGSGGHVILESGEAIDFTLDGPILPRTWIEARGGPRVTQAPSTRGSGGAGGPGVVQLHVPHPERAPGAPGSNVILPPNVLIEPDPLAVVCEPRPHVLYSTVGLRSRARSRWIPLGAAGEPDGTVALLFDGVETAGEDEGKVLGSDGRVPELAPLAGPASLAQPGIELLPDGASLVLSGAVLAPLRASAQPISPDVYLRTPALLAGCTLRLANTVDPGRRLDLAVASATYDDATARLTLAAGELSGTLAEAVAGLGGAAAVELALVPRFFRLRLGATGLDVLPPGHSVRILFQGAADDGTGRADEANPLVDWTGDVGRFGALAPGALDFVRFQVEFERDPGAEGFDPEAGPLALEFLRLPLRF